MRNAKTAGSDLIVRDAQVQHALGDQVIQWLGITGGEVRGVIPWVGRDLTRLAEGRRRPDHRRFRLTSVFGPNLDEKAHGRLECAAEDSSEEGKARHHASNSDLELGRKGAFPAPEC